MRSNLSIASTQGGGGLAPTSFDEHHLDINKLLGIDSKTMVNDTFDDPFITCVFMTKLQQKGGRGGAVLPQHKRLSIMSNSSRGGINYKKKV